MVNIIWSYFIIVGIIYSIVTNNIQTINVELLNSTKTSLKIILEMFPIMSLWLGLMNIAEKSGLLKYLSSKLSSIIKKIFNEIPDNHESISLISTNIIANMFGLGNAATPIGLKAMKSLKELNNNKDEASNSMITFLALNTSGLTIVPTTIISLRMMHNSTNPTEIAFACFLATAFSTIFALIIDRIFRKV